MNQRLAKEARQMFWAWAVVTGAAAFALAMPWGWQPAWTFSHLVEIAFVLVLFFGFPLLAGLPIGYEFQYRTLPALLAAPVDRARIWREKLLVTLAVVLVPAILCALRGRENHVEAGVATLVGAWITALAAGAMFWTLLAKSTMGGLALNVSVEWVLFFAWSYLESRLRLAGYYSAWVEAAAVAFLLGYSGLMVWLGRRALVKFQAVEASAATDPLAELSARLVPRSLADWFRCRPKGMFLNLVRREFRLLRPVWPLAALNVLAWTCLFALGTDPGYNPGLRNPQGALILAALVAAGALSPTIAVLAGTLSLGEEKNYGTHAWHMTLPVSAGLQWIVKCGVAVLTAVIFAGALPPLALAAHEAFLRSRFQSMGTRDIWVWPIVFGCLALAAFWLSTVVKGTVRAALAVFPALFVFWTTGNLGFWSGQKFTAWAQGLSDRILFLLDPFRIAKIALSETWGFPLVEVAMALAVAPVVAFILVESYRRFRGQREDTNRNLARNVLMVTAVALACGAALGDAAGLAVRSMAQEQMLFRDTDTSIRKIEAGRALEAAAPPARFTAEELARAAPFSESTRHWLSAATVTRGGINVRNPRKCCSVFDLVREPGDRSVLDYTAVLLLTNGSKCTMAYRRFVNGFAVVGGRCE